MSTYPRDLFFLLSDPTRFRIAMLLRREGELCVCELVAALDMIQPKISRHLALMREAGLVADRREGTRIYYRIPETLPKWQGRIIDAALEQLAADGEEMHDRQRLEAMANRPERRCVA